MEEGKREGMRGADGRGRKRGKRGKEKEGKGKKTFRLKVTEVVSDKMRMEW